jgi:hypothetical protein
MTVGQGEVSSTSVRQARIYITHCCLKKDEALRESGLSAAPDRLYTAVTVQRFMTACMDTGVAWAIFSDLYGIWFPQLTHPWYEKAPGKVTPGEFQLLLENFDKELEPYEEIRFYYPGRLHPLHGRLLESSRLRTRVHLFSKKAEITA